MTLPFLASLAGTAILDSLNPSLFIAQFFLLTTPRPVPRVLAYLAGVIVSYLVGGLLILSGLRLVIENFFANLPGDLMFGIGLVAGGVILIWGLRSKAAPMGEIEEKKPKSLGLGAAFVFGIVVNGNELTTALPYFIALEQIGAARLSFAQILASLVIYNIIFVLPMLAFLGIFLRTQARFSEIIDRITRGMRVWIPRIMKYAAILFGLALIVNAIAYFASGSPLV